jgi:hypothetical protein
LRVVIEGPGIQHDGGSYRVRINLEVPNEELVVGHQPSLHKELVESGALKSTKKSELKRTHRDVHRAVHEAFHEMRRRLEHYVRRQQD